MKTLFFTLLVSIFLSVNICQAQDSSYISKLNFVYSVKFCQSSDTTISISKIFNTTDSNCYKIDLIDYESKSVNFHSFHFAFSPLNLSDGAYFEEVFGEKLTETIIARLRKSSPNDIVIFANFTQLADGNRKHLGGGFMFRLVP